MCPKVGTHVVVVAGMNVFCVFPSSSLRGLACCCQVGLDSDICLIISIIVPPSLGEESPKKPTTTVVDVQNSTQRKCRITSHNQQRPKQLTAMRVIAPSPFTCDHPCLIKRPQRVPPSLSTVQKAGGLHPRAVRSCRDHAASENCVQHTEAHSVKCFRVRVRCITP